MADSAGVVRELQEELRAALEAEELSEDRNFRLEQELHDLHTKLHSMEKKMKASRKAETAPLRMQLEEKKRDVLRLQEHLEKVSSERKLQLDSQKEKFQKELASLKTQLQAEHDKSLKEQLEKSEKEMQELRSHLKSEYESLAKNIEKEHQSFREAVEEESAQSKNEIRELRVHLENEREIVTAAREEIKLLKENSAEEQNQQLEALQEKSLQDVEKLKFELKAESDARVKAESELQQVRMDLNTEKEKVSQVTQKAISNKKMLLTKCKQFKARAVQTQEQLTKAKAIISKFRGHVQKQTAIIKISQTEAAKTKENLANVEKELQDMKGKEAERTKAQELLKSEAMEAKQALAKCEEDLAVSCKKAEAADSLIEDLREELSKVKSNYEARLASTTQVAESVKAIPEGEMESKIVPQEEKSAQQSSAGQQEGNDGWDNDGGIGDLLGQETQDDSEQAPQEPVVAREAEAIQESSEKFLQALREEVSRKDNELSDLNSSLEELKESYKQLQENHQKEELEKEELVKTLEELKNKFTALEASQSTLQEAHEDLKMQHGKMEDAKSELEKTLAESQIQSSQSNTDLSAIREELEDAKEKITSLKRQKELAVKTRKKLQTRFRDLQKESRLLGRKVKELEAEAKTTATSSAEADEAKTKLLAEFEDLKKEITSLKESKEDMKSKLEKSLKAQETLFNDSEAIQKENQNLEQTISELKKKLQKASEATDSTIEKITPQKSIANEKEEDLKSIERKMKEIESLSKDLEKERTVLQEQKNALNADLAVLLANQKALEVEREELKAGREELKAGREDLKTAQLELDNAEKDLKSKMEKLQEIPKKGENVDTKELVQQIDFDKLREEKEKVERRLEEIKEELENVRIDSTANLKKASDIQAELVALKAKHEEMRAENATEVNAELEKVKRKLIEAQKRAEEAEEKMRSSSAISEKSVRIAVSNVKKVGDQAIKYLRSWESYGKKRAEEDKEREKKTREEKQKREEEEAEQRKKEAEKSRGFFGRMFGKKKAAIVVMKDNPMRWDEASQRYIFERDDEDDGNTDGKDAAPPARLHPPPMAEKLQKTLTAAVLESGNAQVEVSTESSLGKSPAAGTVKMPAPKMGGMPRNPFKSRGLSGRLRMPTVAGFGGPPTSALRESPAGNRRLTPAMPGFGGLPPAAIPPKVFNPNPRGAESIKMKTTVLSSEEDKENTSVNALRNKNLISFEKLKMEKIEFEQEKANLERQLNEARKEIEELQGKASDSTKADEKGSEPLETNGDPDEVPPQLLAAIKRMEHAENRLLRLQKATTERERAQAARVVSLEFAKDQPGGLVTLSVHISKFSAAAMSAMFLGVYAAMTHADQIAG